MRSRHQSQVESAAGQRANETHDSPARPNRTQVLNDIQSAPMLRANETQRSEARPDRTPQDVADALASEMFDAALTAANISTSEVAYLLGISESVVRRMRSKDARERVSFGQMLRLPIEFHVELNKLLDQRYGFGRAAMGRIFSDLGIAAVSLEA
jgi:hypothetical protein